MTPEAHDTTLTLLEEPLESPLDSSSLDGHEGEGLLLGSCRLPPARR